MIRVAIAAVVSVLVGSLAIQQFLSKDNVAHYAQESDPLDGKSTFVIQKNDGQMSNTGEVLIPTAITYLVVRPEETNLSHPIGTTGKVVGKTEVGLDPFIGKEVRIVGDYYDGHMMFLSTQGVPDHLLKSKMAVIHIEQIQPVTEWQDTINVEAAQEIFRHYKLANNAISKNATILAAAHLQAAHYHFRFLGKPSKFWMVDGIALRGK